MTAKRIACLLLLFLPLSLAAVTVEQLKTAFIYNIAKFVRWDATLSDAGSKTIDLCILGDDPVGRNINALSGKRVQQREIAIGKLSAQTLPGDCDILFIPRSENGNLEEILRTLRGKRVLTVSDIDGFAKNGGMIELAMRGGKIQLVINLKSLNAEQIELSAKLLEIATIEGE